MARKSRKIAPQDTPVISDRIYKTAVYIRLSVEEQRDRKDSESLETQKQLILDYIAQDPSLLTCGIYADNGETGTNFDRPEFQRMIYDISKGEIDCIVVKDLSRFGRNHIETGDYLDNFFPMIGVRFIAINDHYDSNVLKPNDGIIIPLKNIINSVYAKDISKKCSAALRMKQRMGDFIGTYAPYGYMKDPDDGHKLIIDPDTDFVVKKIFQWKADGMGNAHIARKLTEDGISCPNKYRFSKGIVKDTKYDSLYCWSAYSVKAILRHPVYAGHMAQGKKKSHFYENKGVELTSPDNWVIVRNTHEPIISQELFDQVQEIMNQRQNEYFDKQKQNIKDDSENIFKHLIYCGECNTKLTRLRIIRNNKVYHSFACPTHAQHLDLCGFSRMSESKLTSAVAVMIKNEISVLVHLDQLLEKAITNSDVRTKMRRIDSEIKAAEIQIKKIVSMKKDLFSDYARQMLNEQEYFYAKKEYDKEYEKWELNLKSLQKKKERYAQFFTERHWIAKLKKQGSSNILTREIIQSFISKIVIYSDKSIMIEWSYQDKIAQQIGALEGEFADECAM